MRNMKIIIDIIVQKVEVCENSISVLQLFKTVSMKVCFHFNL